MTEFSNLAALVAQGQALLDLVKGGHITQLEADNLAKLAEVDAALAEKIAQANTDIAAAIAPINDKITRIQLTKNQELVCSSGTVPDYMQISASVVSELVVEVEKLGVSRDAAQLNILGEIESDIGQQFPDFSIRKEFDHFSSWSIFRLSWDFGGGFDGAESIAQLLNYNDVYHMAGVVASSAALVKLESGEVTSSWVKGAELGKWSFCKTNFAEGDFGLLRLNQAVASSAVGAILIALPVTTTGVIDHPKKLFKNVEIL